MSFQVFQNLFVYFNIVYRTFYIYNHSFLLPSLSIFGHSKSFLSFFLREMGYWRVGEHPKVRNRPVVPLLVSTTVGGSRELEEGILKGRIP